MRIIKFIVCGFLILGLVYSCGTHSCAGFLDRDLKWIPYRVDDTLRYSDSKDTIFMVVNEFYKSPPYSWTGVTMEVSCDEDGHYYTSKSSMYDYQIKDSFINNSSSDNIKIQITEQGDVFRAFDYVKSPYKLEDGSIQRYVADTLIKGIEYNDIYVLQKDTIKGNPRISRVIKSSNKGIIEFYDSKFKRKWNLVNK